MFSVNELNGVWCALYTHTVVIYRYINSHCTRVHYQALHRTTTAIILIFPLSKLILETRLDSQNKLFTRIIANYKFNFELSRKSI